jgi:PAS domain S-box-containing protein
LDPSEIIGSRLIDALPPDVAALILDRIKAALETGEMQLCEYEIMVRRGWQSFEARISPLSRNRVLSLVRNITERKAIEQELRHSEARHRVMIHDQTQSIQILSQSRQDR